MICIGLDDCAKRGRLRSAVADGVDRVFVFGPERFKLEVGDLDVPVEFIEWANIIEYRYYYRILQETDARTLVVLNECLRTQNRHDLTYNCLRNFLQQTKRQLVFQRLPLIDTFDDFMILVDLDTRSRWKREKWATHMRKGIELEAVTRPLALGRVDIETDEATRARYAKEKRALIDGIGLKDPHTIPRNLHLLSGKAKLAQLDHARRYVGRNDRFKLENFDTYETASGLGERTVFEFCHRFIDWSDFLCATSTETIAALVSDLKVDGWYFDRFASWGRRLDDAYAALHG